MENLPLIATAVILGNMARLPVSTMNMVTGLYLATRVAYTIAYIAIESHRRSWIRTVLWVAGMACSMYLIVGAGNVMTAG